MLLSFDLENFKSFRGRQTLSMIASSEKGGEGNVVSFPDAGLSVLRTAFIYGANASGKSNILKGLLAFKRLVVWSATKLNEGDMITGIDPYRLHAETIHEPSFFEFKVLLDGIVYRYGCEVTQSAVHREWMYQRSTRARARESVVFLREGEDRDAWIFSPKFVTGRKHALSKSTRSNCLVLSKAAQENHEFAIPLYRWFTLMLDAVDMGERPGEQIFRAAISSVEDDLDRESALQIARAADETIVDVSADKEHLEVPVEVRAALTERGALMLDAFVTPRVSLHRKIDGSDQTAEFDLHEESNGTQRFFAIGNILIHALEEGQTIFFDELECSLHRSLASELMEVLCDASIGSQRAQFIVATHDSNLLEFPELRRDQVYIAEKNENGESSLTSLWDFDDPPRKGASRAKQYLAGRYGGVPPQGSLRTTICSTLRDRGERPG